MAKFKPLPPLAELQEVLSYNGSTGEFTWLVRRGTQGAGKVAGTVGLNGYKKIRFKRRELQAHRLAWYMKTGEDPGVHTVDHINRIKTDNRFENLRLATHSQQQGNQLVSSSNTSGFRGVSFCKRKNKWRVQLQIIGDVRFLGYFATKQEAAVAYRKAATAYFGEFMAS